MTDYTVPSKSDRDYHESIILEPGITIEGRWLRGEKGHTRDSEPRGIAILEIDGVERSLWLHETALIAKLRDLRPEPGELLRVSKGSEKKTSETTGRQYWPIKATCPERPVAEFDWDDPIFSDAVPEKTPEKTPASDVPSTFESKEDTDAIPF